MFTPRRSPQGRLHPEFYRAIHRSRRTMSTLAQLGEFPSLSSFSCVINPPSFSATPRVVERLKRVAEVIGYTGPVVQPVREYEVAL